MVSNLQANVSLEDIDQFANSDLSLEGKVVVDSIFFEMGKRIKILL